MIALFAVLLQAAPPPSLSAPAGASCIDAAAANSDGACSASSVFLLFFDSSKAEISRDGAAVLDQVATTWRRLPGSRVVVESHSDRSGPASANLRATKERAEAVLQALVARGVERDAVELHPRGEGEPLVLTTDGVREPQNRRVEVRLRQR